MYMKEQNDIQKEPSICIIGGGIIGMMSAYYLSRRTKSKIIILEKNKNLCQGASKTNAGTLFFSRILPITYRDISLSNLWKNRKSINWNRNFFKATTLNIWSSLFNFQQNQTKSEQLQELSRQEFLKTTNSLGIYQNIPNILNNPNNPNKQNNYQKVGYSSGIFQYFFDKTKYQNQIKKYKLQDKENIDLNHPYTNLIMEQLTGRKQSSGTKQSTGSKQLTESRQKIYSVFYHNNYVMNTEIMIDKLKDYFDKNSQVTIKTEVKVSGLYVKNGKIQHLITNQGNIEADKYIICAGIDSNKLDIIEEHDIKDNKNMYLHYHRYSRYFIYNCLNQNNHLNQKDKDSKIIKKKKLKLPILTVSGFSWEIELPYIIRLLSDLFQINCIVGGEQNIFYSIFDKNNDSKLRITYGYFINPINSQNMLNNWDKIIPNIFPFIHLTKPTLCHRPVSPDGLPIICKDREISNLYFNIGHGFLGWTLSCASAKLITDIIEGKVPSIDLSMRRFQLFGGFCDDIP